MSHFLVFYSRNPGDEPRVVLVENEADAVQQLLDAERLLAHDPTHGVVMLVAENEDDLRRTHAHYFESIEDLLAQPIQ